MPASKRSMMTLRNKSLGSLREGSKNDLESNENNFRIKQYLGPNPPKVPLGQSYNEFYQADKDLENGLLNLYKKGLSDEVLDMTFQWIKENLGRGSLLLEEGEDENTAIQRHLKSKV